MSDSILFIFKSFMCVFVFLNVIRASLELLIVHASTFKFQMLGIEVQVATLPAPNAWSNSLFQSLKFFGY